MHKPQEIKIDKEMKTKITNDWLEEFPGYAKIAPRAWKKRVGPVCFHMGYDLDYTHTEYRIGGSYFNLANPLDFMCANLVFEPKTRRSCNITWERHEQGRYKQAAEEMCHQAPIPLDGPVTLSQVIQGYQNHREAEYIIDARMLEDPVLIAGWADRKEVGKQVLEWAKPLYEDQVACLAGRPSTEEWYMTMVDKLSNSQRLKQTVEEQLIYHKLTKVPYVELIIDI